MSEKLDLEQITAEKKLWDVYKLSLSIPGSRFNWGATVAIALLITLDMTITSQPLEDLLVVIQDFSRAGLSFAMGTLGFLVSGFLIFATVSQPGLSVAMAQIEHRQTGMSHLKHNYAIFFRVFIYYLTFSFFCLILLSGIQAQDSLSQLISLFSCPEIIKELLVKISYVTMISFQFFLLFQLKSFLFNIYHSVMTLIRWKAAGHDENLQE